MRGLAISIVVAVACGRGNGGGGGRGLRPGAPERGTVAAGERLEWRVDVPVGQLIAVTLETEGGEAEAMEVSIVGPAGPLATCAPRNVLPRSCGAIAVRGSAVAVQGGAAPTRFTLTLAPPRPPSDADRQRLTAEAAEAEAARAFAAYTEDEIRRAVERYRDAQRIYRALGEVEAEADVAISLSNGHQILGEIPAAHISALAALTLWRRAGEPFLARGEIQAHEWIGSADVGMGHIDDALASFDRAAQLARAMPAPSGDLARVLANRSAVQRRAERWDDAIASLEEARTVADGLPDRALEVLVHHNLGDTYTAVRDFDRALDAQRIAVARARQLGDPAMLAATVQLLAVVHLGLDDPAAAVPLAEESLALIRGGGDPLAVPSALSVLATCKRRAGDARAALILDGEAVAMQRAAADRRELDSALVLLGDDHAELGDRTAAAAAYREALTLADAEGDLATSTRARVELARTVRGAAPAEARDLLARALADHETLRAALTGPDDRRSYFGGVRSVYQLQVELLVDAGRVAESFAAAERARARTLLEALHGATVAPDVRVDEVRGWLPDGTALVELALGERRSLAWIVTRDGVQVIELGPRGPLEALARLVIEQAGARDEPRSGESPEARRARIDAADAAQSVALHELSFRLWRPLAAALTAQRIVVVADGALHLVPFAALPHPDSGEPLVETHELVALPSASVLRELRARRRATTRPARIAVLADPEFGGAMIRLHASRGEAQAIAARFPGRSFVALDADASATTLAGPEVRAADVVHIATHGVVDLREPARTGLVLARGGAVDGFVDLGRIAGLQLSAELAVLSACHTAFGPVINGEGMRGLDHAFLAAGVPRVVASLWAVQDQATAALMTGFYAALTDGGMAPAAALRAAQRALREDPRYRAPYFWAGFVARGDWN